MHYKAFHLHFIAPLECPELMPVDADETELDRVTITWGSVAEHLDAPLNVGKIFEARADAFLLRVKDVARYLIRNGNEIIIDPAPGVDESTIRLFLFGSAVGALLQQRGMLTLHASAVTTEKGAVLFAGPSGGGKSTTLQTFLRRGYKKLSDDTIALYADKTTGVIHCLPSYPQSKIWQQTADLLEEQTDELRRVRPGVDKFALSTHEHFSNDAVPLHALYVLRPMDEGTLTLKPVEKLQRFNVLRNNTYRLQYLDHLPYKKQYFELVTKAAAQCHVMRCFRPGNENTLSALANLIENDFKALP